MCALTEAGVIYTYQSVSEEKVTIDGGQRQGYYINTSTLTTSTYYDNNTGVFLIGIP